MKKIEDYLKFYIGCEVQHNDGKIGVLTKVSIGTEIETTEYFCDADEVKLILRQLSSMTKEEVKELESTKALQRPSPVHPIAMLVWTAETYRLAMSKHFDIFGLIDAKLALDSTKIEKV